jgi:ubiquinone/menaquinone biosynthesis C-methylase UbiE
MPRPETTFDLLSWRDPLTSVPLTPVVTARTPGGVPLCGALQVDGTNRAYPIVDAIARVTPHLAERHRAWLEALALRTPSLEDAGFQNEDTVDSFGFQWSWAADMRSEGDLLWRVAERFGLSEESFRGKLVLDAGAGAGDQSRWLLQRRARVVSVDLSSSIEVVARKLREDPCWVGVQADIAALPLADASFDVVYCEGVIQHTRDSGATVRELCRVLRPGGLMLATHYERPLRLASRLRLSYEEWLRRRLRRLDRYALLLLTGLLAATGYVPVLGHLLRRSGTVAFSDLMPDLKTTWTNTYDRFGTHAYQRFVTPAQFWSFFESAGTFERLHIEGNCVAARRRPTGNPEGSVGPSPKPK